MHIMKTKKTLASVAFYYYFWGRGKVHGPYIVLVEAGAATKHKGSDNGGNTSRGVDDDATGKVQRAHARQPATAPDLGWTRAYEWAWQRKQAQREKNQQ
jgi:hypothetical protein